MPSAKHIGITLGLAIVGASLYRYNFLGLGRIVDGIVSKVASVAPVA
jgi:hypothetical protein